MQLGEYRIRTHNHGFFRLDGGAMFGTVPKALWAKEAPPDDENRILLATRSLVLDWSGRRALVDVGCGDKWNEKSRAIFCIGAEPYSPVPEVTDVILTHLHFDHAGGVSRYVGRGPEVEPCYPEARHYVPQANLANARSPNIRERASYLPENVEPLEVVPKMLTHDGQELMPGLTVHRADGHTRGLQWLKLEAGQETIAFPADLIPTSKHLPLPYVMGYDICAERSLAEKAAFLRQAAEESWIVVFEHDPVVAAGRIGFDERGKAVLIEEVALPEL